MRAGNRAVAAVKTDGTLWMWGQNQYGRFGLGNTTNYSSPKQVGALTDWATCRIGSGNVAARKTDGTLWTWGRNQNGQLGLGNTTHYSSPKQVGGLTDWAIVAAGRGMASGIKTDGTLWTWGYNQQGQLGLGTSGPYTSRSSPVKVGSATDWAAIEHPDLATVAMRGVFRNRSIWGWGSGSSFFQNFSYTNLSTPTQKGSVTTWSDFAKIAPAAKHGILFKSNDQPFAWGSNVCGQLGTIYVAAGGLTANPVRCRDYVSSLSYCNTGAAGGDTNNGGSCGGSFLICRYSSGNTTINKLKFAGQNNVGVAGVNANPAVGGSATYFRDVVTDKKWIDIVTADNNTNKAFALGLVQNVSASPTPSTTAAASVTPSVTVTPSITVSRTVTPTPSISVSVGCFPSCDQVLYTDVADSTGFWQVNVFRCCYGSNSNCNNGFVQYDGNCGSDSCDPGFTRTCANEMCSFWNAGSGGFFTGSACCTSPF